MKKVLLFLGLLLVILTALRWLAPHWLVQGGLAGGRLFAGLTPQMADVDGLQMRYLEGGDGPTVVLVHGFGGDAENWLLLARHLTADYRVLAPDLPGFGASAAPADGHYDVIRQADRLAAFVALLAPGEQVHLVGNSMGGQIVTVMSARHPRQVASLALLDPLGVESEPGIEPSAVMRALNGGRNLLLPEDRADFDEFADLLFFRRPPTPGFLIDHYAEQWLVRRDRLAAVFDDISTDYVPLVPLLAQIDVPALVVWGADDQLLPAAGANLLVAGLARGEKVIIAECGHLPMVEKPRETAQAYRAFLARAAAP